MSEFDDKYSFALDYINHECNMTDDDFRKGLLECLIEISENLNSIAESLNDEIGDGDL